MNRKKMMLIFVFICTIIFLFYYYIFCILGNNKNINQDKIVEYIMSKFQEYEADMVVTVKSNKNENIYEMSQIEKKDSSIQKIKSPENVKDLEIEFFENKLKIKNSKINMEKIYENYSFVLNNNLFLSTFAEDLKKEKFETEVSGEELVIKVKINREDTYIKSKELYIDTKTKKPTKLVLNDSQKSCISIKYNNVIIK